MLERRRVFRQPCDLSGRVFTSSIHEASADCEIFDISSHGAFIRPKSDIHLPSSFNLVIGNSNSARSCRLARVVGDGVGIEFLDPVRAEIEKALMETAFEEEILFDLIAGVTIDASTNVARLRRAVAAMMDIMERRNEMTWQQSKVA